MTTTTSGVSIAYDDLGAGEPALLCLPGWCGDRTVYDPVLPLSSAHRRSLAVDLPGHGDSSSPGGDFGMAEVVEGALGVVERSGAQRVVPVALSHAGWVAIELRRRLGAERVPGIVLLDWMVLGPPPGFLDAVGALQQPEAWQDVRAGLFEMWTTGVEVDALHRYVASMGEYGFDMWSRAGREISASFAAEGTPLAALERLHRPCPTLHIYAQPTDEGYLSAQEAYAAEHPWFSVRRLHARSHFPMFEDPDTLARFVEEFVAGLAVPSE